MKFKNIFLGALAAASVILAGCDPYGSGPSDYGNAGNNKMAAAAPSGTFFSAPAITNTYVAGATGLVAAASATDVFTITGSASGTIHINRLCVGGRATAAANADVLLIKRSTADTGGTSTAPNEVLMDSGISGASGAVLAAYTANPTLGTGTATYVGAREVGFGNLTTALGNNICFDWGNTAYANRPALHGVAQQLAVNLGGVTFSGNLLDIEVTYTLN